MTNLTQIPTLALRNGVAIQNPDFNDPALINFVLKLERSGSMSTTRRNETSSRRSVETQLVPNDGLSPELEELRMHLKLHDKPGGVKLRNYILEHDLIPATVRQRMKRLIQLGFAERVDHGSYRLLDNVAPAPSASLTPKESAMWNYLQQYDENGVSIAQISEEFKLSRTGATTTLRRLIDKNHVERVEPGWYRALD